MKTYIGVVGQELLSKKALPRCMMVPPSTWFERQEYRSMDDWKLLVAMDAQSEPYELGLGDPGFVPKLSRPDGFEPQMWGSLPWGFGRFNSYVLPGIYGEVA